MQNDDEYSFLARVKGDVGKHLCATFENISEGKDRTQPELTVGEVFEYNLDAKLALLN